MGWFSAKNKSGRGSKSKRGKGRKKSKSTGRGWQSLSVGERFALVVAGAVFGLAAISLITISTMVGWEWAEQSLEQSVALARSQEAEIRPEQVYFVGMPDHINDTIRSRLRTQVAGSLGSNPLNNAPLAGALAAIEQDPWVSKSLRIERHSDSVRVFAEYRTPMAVVDDGGNTLRLVDEAGIVLRDDYLKLDRFGKPTGHLDYLRKQCGYPVIVGVREPAPAPGQHWASQDLLGAIATAKLIEQQVFADEVVAYDAGERYLNGRQRVKLLVQVGDGVFWGSPPGSERPLEDKAATKLRWLMNEYRRGLGSLRLEDRTVYLDMGYPAISSASTN